MFKHITIGLFLVINVEAFAQILVGPVVGGQIDWIKFGDSENKDLYSVEPVYGFHVGGSIAFRVQKRFFLQASVLYSQKGKVIDGKLDQSLRNDATFKYIDVPLLYTAEFKAKIGRDKVYKIYLGAGPNISYWLGGKGVLNHSDLNENLINPPDYNLPYTITFNKDPLTIRQGEMNVEDPNRIQLGLQASTGLIFEPWGEQKIMLTARYIFGHSYLSKTSNGDFGLPNELYYEDALKVRTQELAMSLYYFI
ncbi:MAG: PorT family protein, partial [Cyclobacteriaceae bacterium]|nr:PorT family protein [Cyclobacteriaceae bacterium]